MANSRERLGLFDIIWDWVLGASHTSLNLAKLSPDAKVDPETGKPLETLLTKKGSQGHPRVIDHVFSEAWITLAFLMGSSFMDFMDGLAARVGHPVTSFWLRLT